MKDGEVALEFKFGAAKHFVNIHDVISAFSKVEVLLVPVVHVEVKISIMKVLQNV